LESGLGARRIADQPAQGFNGAPRIFADVEHGIHGRRGDDQRATLSLRQRNPRIDEHEPT